MMTWMGEWEVDGASSRFCLLIWYGIHTFRTRRMLNVKPLAQPIGGLGCPPRDFDNWDE